MTLEEKIDNLLGPSITKISSIIRESISSGYNKVFDDEAEKAASLLSANNQEDKAKDVLSMVGHAWSEELRKTIINAGLKDRNSIDDEFQEFVIEWILNKKLFPKPNQETGPMRARWRSFLGYVPLVLRQKFARNVKKQGITVTAKDDDKSDFWSSVATKSTNDDSDSIFSKEDKDDFSKTLDVSKEARKNLVLKYLQKRPNAPFKNLKNVLKVEPRFTNYELRNIISNLNTEKLLSYKYPSEIKHDISSKEALENTVLQIAKDLGSNYSSTKIHKRLSTKNRKLVSINTISSIVDELVSKGLLSKPRSISNSDKYSNLSIEDRILKIAKSLGSDYSITAIRSKLGSYNRNRITPDIIRSTVNDLVSKGLLPKPRKVGLRKTPGKYEGLPLEDKILRMARAVGKDYTPASVRQKFPSRIRKTIPSNEIKNILNDLVSKGLLPPSTKSFKMSESLDDINTLWKSVESLAREGQLDETIYDPLADAYEELGTEKDDLIASKLRWMRDKIYYPLTTNQHTYCWSNYFLPTRHGASSDRWVKQRGSGNTAWMIPEDIINILELGSIERTISGRTSDVSYMSAKSAIMALLDHVPF